MTQPSTLAEIQCDNVKASQTFNFEIALTQRGRGYDASWRSDCPVAPDWGQLSLELGDRQVASHKTDSAAGDRRELLDRWGAGYVLSYVARSFPPVRDTRFVATTPTTSGGGTVTGSTRATYKVWLGMNGDGEARVTWETDLGIRPRQSKIRVFRKGEQVFDEWVEAASGHFDTEVPWGVNLSAALVGEDFTGTYQDLVRTPTTRRH